VFPAPERPVRRVPARRRRRRSGRPTAPCRHGGGLGNARDGSRLRRLPILRQLPCPHQRTSSHPRASPCRASPTVTGQQVPPGKKKARLSPGFSVSCRRGAQARANTRVALVPPKPKLLDITTSSCASRLSRAIGKPSAF